jgi:hypothetical protein
MRTGRKETTKNWITLLNDLKQSLENKNYKYLTSIIRNNNASSYWGTFLKDNKIIYKNEQGYYKWNEKVPISIKLINAYRRYSSTMNKKDKKIAFDLFSSENIKQEAKKVEVKFYKEKKNDLGLIRKFLKWLW